MCGCHLIVLFVILFGYFLAYRVGPMRNGDAKRVFYCTYSYILSLILYHTFYCHEGSQETISKDSTDRNLIDFEEEYGAFLLKKKLTKNIRD